MGRYIYYPAVFVDPVGFEPTTFSMPLRRAPNCAMGPGDGGYFTRLLNLRQPEWTLVDRSRTDLITYFLVITGIGSNFTT